jgi:hypothetical protein
MSCLWTSRATPAEIFSWSRRFTSVMYRTVPASTAMLPTRTMLARCDMVRGTRPEHPMMTHRHSCARVAVLQLRNSCCAHRNAHNSQFEQRRLFRRFHWRSAMATDRRALAATPTAGASCLSSSYEYDAPMYCKLDSDSCEDGGDAWFGELLHLMAGVRV